MPAVDKKTLRAALGMHANSFRYLKNMEKATTRFDLQGNSVGEITDEHRAHASETLRERAKKAPNGRKPSAKPKPRASAPPPNSVSWRKILAPLSRPQLCRKQNRAADRSATLAQPASPTGAQARRGVADADNESRR